MIQKIIYKKIAIATSILLVILLLYLIPTNKEEIDLNKKQHLEYIYPNNLEVVYLLDNNNYLSRTKISINKKDYLEKVTDIIEVLKINGKKKDIIPTGFKSLLPEKTKILNIELKDKILTLDFSKEFNNIKQEYEEKLIESLAYTLTSIDGIDKVQIFIEGKKLTNLPNSKAILPEYLDKKYGINKKYEFTNISDMDSYTIYYVSNINDELYYTPVTKYINNKHQDKIKIIIDELRASLTYETNLMSFLDNNAKLLNYEFNDNIVKLNFNDLILSDISNSQILEEVIYTIGLSLYDEFDIEKVIFEVNNQEISTFLPKTID